MRKVLWIAAAATLTASALKAEDPAIPLTITSGFNGDIVADGSGSAATSTSEAFDAAGNVFYNTDYDTSHGNHGGSLPMGTTIMDSAGNQYSLAPATGNNALLVGAGGAGGTLTFSYPANNALTSLLLLGASADGDTLLDYTLNFAGGLTVSGLVNIANWHDSAANGTFTSFGRISLDDEFNSEQGRIFSLHSASILIPLEDQLLHLDSITFGYNSANADYFGIFPRAAIVGVSAFDPIIAAVPEPTSTGLAICGALVLAAGVRRKLFKH
jgi:hypothetical protein